MDASEFKAPPPRTRTVPGGRLPLPSVSIEPTPWSEFHSESDAPIVANGILP